MIFALLAGIAAAYQIFAIVACWRFLRQSPIEPQSLPRYVNGRYRFNVYLAPQRR